MQHLDVLELSLSNERMRLSAAKSEKEKRIREVFVKQIESEISAERKFLGLKDVKNHTTPDDDDLLSELLN